MAKEYLDKAGLERLVELLKGEIGKAGGGNSIFSTRNYWSYDGDSPVQYCGIVFDGDYAIPKVGDLGITKDGILFRVYDHIGSTEFDCEYLCSLKGTNGKDGLSVLYYGYSWDSGVTMLSMGELLRSNGRQPKVNDLVITANGVLLKVVGINTMVMGASVEYLCSLKGTDGTSGKSIVFMADEWPYFDGSPMYEENLYCSDFYDAPKPGDLGISADGTLFTVVDCFTDEVGIDFAQCRYLISLKDQPDLSEYLKKTDVSNGLYMNSQGKVIISKAEKNMIDSKANAYNPIVPATQDYAWKMSAIDNKEEWTDEEKAAARKTLGIDTVVGDINTVLESILGV